MLKERNIAVYFEVEKINTLKDGEFLMTILSSVAQQEVENTSAYVKKGLKMKMKRGELVGFQVVWDMIMMWKQNLSQSMRKALWLYGTFLIDMWQEQAAQ